MKSVFDFENVKNGEKMMTRVEMDLPILVPNGSKVTYKKTGLSYVVCANDDIEVDGTDVTIHYETCLIPSE